MSRSALALLICVAGDAGAAPVSVAPASVPGVPLSSPAPSTSTSASTSTSTCVQDDAVPTPRGWQGWDRTAVIAWEAVERAGGVVPEIEEDRTQAPPAWWRYPSAVRSEALLDAESKNSGMGLYSAVSPSDIAEGDILVRVRGAGVCGKMAVVGGKVDDQWVTIEVGPDGRGPSTRPASPLFFGPDGQTLLPHTRVFRIRVKKEATIGHIRELRRDLDHLERTVGHQPPLLAPEEEAKQAVTEKIHDLVDEAWSLVADQSFDLDRRELAGRALALGAQLGWPAAAVAADAVLADVLKKSQHRPAAAATRASLARSLAKERGARDGSGRHEGVGAGVGVGVGVGEGSDSIIRYIATPDEVGVESRELGFQIRWPLTWRVMGLAANAETGVLANLVTGRVLLPDGHADRGAAVLLAQRPAGASARTALAREGARKMFPSAKMKTLPAIVPGSRHHQFRERRDGISRAAEVTTIDRGGVVTFLVLNAPGDVYPKLRDEYASFVRSLSVLPGAAPPAPSPSPPGGAAGR